MATADETDRHVLLRFFDPVLRRFVPAPASMMADQSESQSSPRKEGGKCRMAYCVARQDRAEPSPMDQPILNCIVSKRRFDSDRMLLHVGIPMKHQRTAALAHDKQHRLRAHSSFVDHLLVARSSNPRSPSIRDPFYLPNVQIKKPVRVTGFFMMTQRKKQKVLLGAMKDWTIESPQCMGITLCSTRTSSSYASQFEQPPQTQNR